MSATDTTAVRARVRAVIRDMAGLRPDAVEPAASLVVDLGYDSLGLIELAGALEEEFDLPPVPEEEVEAVETVDDAERLVLGMLERAEAR